MSTSQPTANPSASSADPNQQSLLEELYGHLERENDPQNTVIRELILQQWQRLGDCQAAYEMAKEILEHDPSHCGANAFVQAMQRNGTRPSASTSSLAVPTEPRQSSRGSTSNSSSTRRRSSNHFSATSSHRPSSAISSASSVSPRSNAANSQPIMIGPSPQTEAERTSLEEELVTAFARVQVCASHLEEEMLVLQNVGIIDNAAILQHTRDIQAGNISSVVMPPVSRPVRQLARELLQAQAAGSSRQRCLELVVHDFFEVAQRVLELEEESAGDENTVDIVTRRLRQRQTLLDAMLPPSEPARPNGKGGGEGADYSNSLEGLGRMAVMLVGHQMLLPLGMCYANAKTMRGKAVADIPPEQLLVTADNCAWDMTELVTALEDRSGVMRNPLTRDMFDREDVQQILAHPLGRRLRPLRRD